MIPEDGIMAAGENRCPAVLGKGMMTHETIGLQFLTGRLATDVTLSYAECGKREGEAIIFLYDYSDLCYSICRVLPSLPAELRPVARLRNFEGRLPNTRKGATA